ncbi:30S ribosomal protein S6 [Buchnera aphidicola (Rhopalosiphum padi)]|jgi:small subunit ribosomal protein S6|uniref:Small ribosomal subunit protein bS6 n=1 Tax=Buchnera aphidicola subsp. Rhopalosiphum padi TaxID=98793 RepID=A0A4D6Y7D5_BUCRP|nr:30S ribosomal protein S6 [Buchnera aphidicola]QCI25182.1 30S ribosomal protein S6 [Buchnera aphidicola (Rhopalosiphum padi)]
MRHYEIIFMIHPDYSEKVSIIIEKYKKIIHDNFGVIHRLEDWGRRQLSYPINKLHKAHYILLNIETSPNTISLLETDFRFNNAIIRNIIISVKKAISEVSPVMKLKEEKKDKK